MFATENPPIALSPLTLRRFPQRSFIPPEADTLWKISQGVVRTLTWNEAGTAISLGLWTAGDVVGVALSRVHPYEIECLSDVQVQAIPRSHWRHLTEQLIDHAQESQQLLAIIRQERIRDRLLVFLHWLSYKFGHGSAEGRVIELKLSHRAIAEILGTSRVTVTRTLGQLEEEGLMERRRECWHLSLESLPS
ncbi:Crp/Fnr family transcriptional regulator [Phormidium yuhuli AB48]|uniref:Crp/Fnr family transcriptional regulator n=1 Tax=Phormidium yuhuli AB48 TaxID=2940671 RepID=A0ABY5AST8_9CYAN|nr:Crp/Fnr family transcriptional regulator [Phormidium yuhuli]USR91913.1 Crp/Fnr family transcriptional regulator [Phormidium yuhuli AB48]